MENCKKDAGYKDDDIMTKVEGGMTKLDEGIKDVERGITQVKEGIEDVKRCFTKIKESLDKADCAMTKLEEEIAKKREERKLNPEPESNFGNGVISSSSPLKLNLHKNTTHYYPPHKALLDHPCWRCMLIWSDVPLPHRAYSTTQRHIRSTSSILPTMLIADC